MISFFIDNLLNVVAWNQETNMIACGTCRNEILMYKPNGSLIGKIPLSSAAEGYKSRPKTIYFYQNLLLNPIVTWMTFHESHSLLATLVDLEGMDQGKLAMIQLDGSQVSDSIGRRLLSNLFKSIIGITESNHMYFIRKSLLQTP